MTAVASYPEITVESYHGFLLGEYLGGGVARRTYRSRLDWNAVVKLEPANCDFQNIAEWHLWSNASASLEAWLAPCITISPCGRILMQRFVEPITEDRLPDKVPGVLSDLHMGNWGWLDGRPVALDYGRNLAGVMSENTRLKKVDWA